MHDLYTYCRLIDDITDEDGLTLEARRDLLQEIRRWLNEKKLVGHPFWDRFQQEINSLGISWNALHGILDGVSMDLDPAFKRMQTWKDLDQYIYGVASCVGEAVLEILGVGGARGKTYAQHMGRALQLWNILRDLEADQKLGRIYIPSEFLGTHSLETQLPRVRAEIYRMALNEWTLAIPYSWKCLPAEMMGAIYKEGATVYWKNGSEKRLSRFEKLICILKCLIKFPSSFSKK